MMNQLNIRKPSAAGQFYPSQPDVILEMISSFGSGRIAQKQNAIGCMLPHAGYAYSGSVAVQTLSGISIKDTVILLGPNHYGSGPDFSLMVRGYWQTPLGNVEIDSRLANLFLSSSRYLEADTLAHTDEHSLEVELPMLQYFKKDFKIVPIVIKNDELDKLKIVADELAGVIIRNNLINSIIFVASSDMTHYESQKSAERKDAMAIEAITALDEDKLGAVVKRADISMCGFAAVAVLLRAARLLGAKKGRLVKYQTSGDVSGDTSSVVGYAGVTIC
ncbi:MAG: AmmeMemoRadiSam system protein B [Candidatus Omnitrophica bacterium]|nr:AmmeMemoRadiSam system protein B [Candidatus Omnitrophota bacterium]